MSDIRQFVFNVTAPSTDAPSNLPTTPGTWAKISSATSSAIAPSPLPAGGHVWPQGVLSFSGAGWDAATKTWYFTGGGHADYAGNEVYSITLAASSPTLVRRCDPTPAAQVVSTGALPTATYLTDVGSYNADGRPMATHTYQHNVYCPEINRFMRFGCGAQWATGGPSTMQVDGFNTLTNAWDAPRSYQQTGTGLNLGAKPYSPVTRDPRTGRIWYGMYRNAFGSQSAALLDIIETGLYWWHPSTPNTRTRAISADILPGDGGGAFAIDTSRDRLFYAARDPAGNITTRTYDLTTFAPTNQPQNVGLGAAAYLNENIASNYAAMVYAPEKDAYYYMMNRGDVIYKINAATFEVSLEVSGLPRISEMFSGMQQRLAWVPEWGGLTWVPSLKIGFVGEGVYFYKVQ